MNSNSVPIANLITWALWTTVAMLTAAAWLSWLGGAPRPVPLLLGMTSAAVVGPATVAHIGLYAARTCTLIRRSAPVGPPAPPDLYTVQR